MELFRLFGSIFVDNEDANRNISETDKKAEKTGGTFSKMGGMAAKAGIAIGAMAAAAAVGIGIKAFTATEDLQKALNGLQTQTGATSDDMDVMKESLLEIYNNNFGESFADIAETMGKISQQTGLSGEALKDFSTNALMIKDTFGIEVNESLRAVNQLMKNFGISSKEAFTLLAQGAQNGLNANENLADTINEYSVHFAQLGLNSEEMFNSLINGANAGVFDIDKLGDAVKEFGIRVKDNSDATNMAFSQLGLNAQQIGNDFVTGGEKGKLAFETVTARINDMKDPMLQNQIGVALFGTMWEDIGAKGVAALTMIEDGTNKNADTLKKINEIKYDTFSEALTGLGRQFETAIFIPLGEKILPILNRFANWVNENMPAIKQFINTAMDAITNAFNVVYNFIKNNILPIFDNLRNNSSINFEEIKSIIQTVVDIIVQNILPPLIEIFEFIYTEIVPRLVEAFVKYWPKISEIIKNVVTLIGIYLSEMKKGFDIVFPYIREIVIFTFDVIAGAVEFIIGVLSGLIKFITGVFTGNWKMAWEGVKDVYASIWDAIRKIFQDEINWLTEKIEWVLKKVESVKKAFSAVSSMVSGGINTVTSFVTGARANGGSVIMNKPYLVGEKGAELFVPNSSGTIIPNNKLSSKAGTTINVTVTGNTLMNDRDADKLGDLLIDRLKILGVT